MSVIASWSVNAFREPIHEIHIDDIPDGVDFSTVYIDWDKSTAQCLQNDNVVAEVPVVITFVR